MKLRCISIPFLVSINCIVAVQFLVGKTDKMDSRVRKRSERAVQLEMAHKAIVGHMNLEEYEIKPIPPPPPIADEK
jgi:hypothetical protein